ncbi:hypothetical protein D3C76_1683420 [compost metagenome]
MNEIQVEVVQTELVQTCLIGGQGGLITQIGIPYFRGNEQIFSSDRRLLEQFGNSLSHAAFILIDCRCIDAAVAMLHCGFYRLDQFRAFFDFKNP